MDSFEPAPDVGPASDQKGRRKHSDKKQPISRAERTLSCVAQALEGSKLLVELRNDMVIRGTLTEADEYMNLYMSDVTCQDQQGCKTKYAFLYVKGRNVRFLHLPKSFNPQEAVEQQRQKLVKLRVASYKAQQRASAAWLPKGDAGSAYDQEQQQKAEEPGLRNADLATTSTAGAVQEVVAQSAAFAAELHNSSSAGLPGQLPVGSSRPSRMLPPPEPASFQGLPAQPASVLHQAAQSQGGEGVGQGSMEASVQVGHGGQEGGEGAREEDVDDEEEGEMWEEYVEHPLLMSSSDEEGDVGEEEQGYGEGGGAALVGTGENASEMANASRQQPSTIGAQGEVEEEDEFDFD